MISGLLPFVSASDRFGQQKVILRPGKTCGWVVPGANHASDRLQLYYKMMNMYTFSMQRTFVLPMQKWRTLLRIDPFQKR